MCTHTCFKILNSRNNGIDNPLDIFYGGTFRNDSQYKIKGTFQDYILLIVIQFWFTIAAIAF